MVLDDDDLLMASQIGSHGFRGPIGREVEMAVLFADVVGYTTMAEALPPYDIVHLLNRFFTGASVVVEANSGHIDNYMGDAILALFGVHDESAPAVGAIRAGLGVLDTARSLNRYVERIYGTTFAVRVGVDFGEAVFGLLGAENSARETAIGDVVNVASRLEGANKEVGTDMLVSEAVFQACSGEFSFGRTFELDLRGKVGRVTAHEVLGARRIATCAMSASGPTQNGRGWLSSDDWIGEQRQDQKPHADRDEGRIRSTVSRPAQPFAKP